MWVVCRLSVFCEPFTDRAFGFPYILFFTFLRSIISVRLVELQVICCFICLVSPVLLKVYEVLALSM